MRFSFLRFLKCPFCGSAFRVGLVIKKKEWKGSLEKIETVNKIILPHYKPMLRARDLVYKCISRLK